MFPRPLTLPPLFPLARTGSSPQPCKTLTRTFHLHPPNRPDERDVAHASLVFRSGRDGSRSIRDVKVNAAGTGNNFVAARVVKNGNPVSRHQSCYCLTAYLTFHAEPHGPGYRQGYHSASSWDEMYGRTHWKPLRRVGHNNSRLWQLRRG